MDNPGKFAKDALVQRALLDYDPKVKYLPEENRIADLGTGFDSWRDLYKTKTPTEFKWTQTGFQMCMRRMWTRYIFLYYIPTSLCVFASWVSFLISLDILAARSGLLVSLFLSLTVLLVSAITSSPRVSASFTALTAWILIQYAFLFLALAALGFHLVKRRYSKLNKEVLQGLEKKLDKCFLIIFISGYIITSLFYLSIIIVYYNY